MKKKLALSLVLILAIVFMFSGCDSILSNSVGSVKYKIVDNHAEVIALPNGSNDKDIVIEDEYEGVPVTVIADFAGCNLEAAEVIHIGKNIEEIGNWAFSNNQKLKTYDINAENKNFCIIDGAIFNTDKTVLISYPCCGKTNFVMPNTVETVRARAFYKNENIESITLSTSLMSIEDMAFFQCSKLTKIDFPNTLRTIGKDAFTKCTSLEEIVIPSSIDTIREYAFYNCTSAKKVVVKAKKDEIKLGEKWYPTANGNKIDDATVEYAE